MDGPSECVGSVRRIIFNTIRYTQKLTTYRHFRREMYLCSSPAIQPVNNVDFNKLTDVGQEIDTFFSNESNVAKLIEYLSLEEIKGEPLRCHNIYLFKVSV